MFTVDDGGDGGFEPMEPGPEDDQQHEQQQVHKMTFDHQVTKCAVCVLLLLLVLPGLFTCLPFY